jgi:hypothetical protein
MGCEGSSQGRNAASCMLGRKDSRQRVFHHQALGRLKRKREVTVKYISGEGLGSETSPRSATTSKSSAMPRRFRFVIRLRGVAEVARAKR